MRRNVLTWFGVGLTLLLLVSAPLTVRLLAATAYVAQSAGFDGALDADVTTTAANFAAGTSVVCHFSWNTDTRSLSTLTASDGTTLVSGIAPYQQTTDLDWAGAYYAHNIVGSATWSATMTLSGGSFGKDLRCENWTGMANSAPQTATLNNGSGTAISVGPLTAAGNDAAYTAYVRDTQTSAITFTVGGSFVERLDSDGIQNQGLVQNPAASLSSSWTGSSSVRTMAHLLVFEASGGAASTCGRGTTLLGAGKCEQ